MIYGKTDINKIYLEKINHETIKDYPFIVAFEDLGQTNIEILKQFKNIEEAMIYAQEQENQMTEEDKRLIKIKKIVTTSKDITLIHYLTFFNKKAFRTKLI